MTSDADSTLANLRRTERPREAVEGARTSASATRPGAAAATCAPEYYADQYRRTPPSSRATRGNRVAEDRQRRQRRRLQLDRSADDAAPRKHMDGLSLHYYTLPDRRLGRRRASATRFRRGRVARDAVSARCGWTSCITQAHRDHGQVRSRRSASALYRRRVGHLVRRRSRARTRVPLPAEHAARRARRRRSTSTSSTRTPTACRWPTSRRWSTCCRP